MRLAILWKHRRFLMVLVLFIGLTQYYSWAVAPFEGPDEPEHLAYVAQLLFDRKLPDPRRDFEKPIRQEVAQPPFYYTTAALFTAVRSFPEWQHNINHNPWAGYPAPATSVDNRNQFLMSPDYNVLTDNQRLMVRALRWIRIVSVFYGVITLTGIYLAGHTILPTRNLALFATLAFALTPQVLHSFAVVSNDVAVIAFGALVLATTLVLFKRWNRFSLLLLAGVFMGLAGLSKASGLITWVLPPLSVILGWSQTRAHRSFLTALGYALLPLIIASVISGWWYARSLILFNDPLGIQPHLRMSWALEEPITLTETFQRIPHTFQFLWADFGWGAIRPSWMGYMLPGFIVILSVMGWFRKREFETTQLLLAFYILVGFAAFVRWLQLMEGVYARLLLPYYGALVLLVTVGLNRLSKRVVYWVSAGLGLSALLMVPFVIRPALGPPQLYNEIEIDLKPPVMNFFGPRFLGYQINQEDIQTEKSIQFTLCWAAPPGERPLPVPYPFTLQVISPAGQPVASRESYPGMGNYTLWEPGKAFCDQVNLPIDARLEPGQVYLLWMTLFEYDTKLPVMALSETGEVLPQRWIGHLCYPAEQLSQSGVGRIGC